MAAKSNVLVMPNQMPEITSRRSGALGPDAVALAAALRGRIRGEVRFDQGSRALYATDGSNYRQLPIGVVVPRDEEDVIATVAACREQGAPVLGRGGGTSLAGQCCNVAVVLDFSKYMAKILQLDPEKKRARVQPGVILDDLRNAAEKHHLTFAPDPSTHTHCTLGGMIGNNSCGVHSVMAGKTEENIEELDILTYDGVRMRVGATSDQDLERLIRSGGRVGEIYRQLKTLRDRYANLIRQRYPQIPRRVSGYNLNQLLPENGFHVARALVGSEGTCVMVLGATTRLVYSPPQRALLVLGYPDVYTAGDHVPEILKHKPIGLEGIDDVLVRNMEKKGMHKGDEKLLPEGKGWVLVEFGGETKQQADNQARDLMRELEGKNAPTMKLYDDRTQEKKVWEIRESGLGATAFVPGEPVTWEGWEDSAVPPHKLGGYLRDLRRLMEKFNYRCALYGHFGQGCIHTRIDFDLNSRPGIQKYRAFVEEAADLVVSYGGSLSGEHGDGQSRAELLPKMFGPELVQAFREFKAIWDPEGKMNPHKVVDPYRLDENLRLGADYHPAQLDTHFQYPDDHGSFAHAAMRCVGVGKCRRYESQTMCPSFRVTREEQHTTRGRAHLLFEMMRGGIKAGWRDQHVKESLDLCLACKGCKGDCPVNVDIATYKAEFLSHFYEGRLRPRSAYAMGLIDVWARMASAVPGLVNLFTQTPLLRDVAKFAAGMPPQRTIPAFAPQTFKNWFRKRPARNESKPSVILWPDTFNNYFFPETAMAGVEVLEAAGFRVIVPEQNLCCGRPLYDFGMLDRGKRLLRQILEVLQPEINAGIPVVGLEPSCVAVFRDELRNLFPQDETAKRLREQTFFFSEFLEKKAKDFYPRRLQRKALVHAHCHHKSLIKTESENSLLKKLRLDFEMLDSGCCGMAGSFGFEKEKYDVSMAVGELVLLPKVRSAPTDTLIVAEGFSCREQIAQGTGRQALHPAEVIQMAMREGPFGPGGQYPEMSLVRRRQAGHRRSMLRAGVALGGIALGAGALLWQLNRKK